MATEVISRVDKFGLMNTFNPYKNSLSLRNVSNQRFRIDNKATYADTNVVCVTTGLIPNYEAFLGGGITFNILNPNTQIVEAILQPKIVDLGSGIIPMVNEIHWFDVVGMQGDFYVNSQWAGYILEVGGNIETCSITAEDINGINNDISYLKNRLVSARQQTIPLINEVSINISKNAIYTIFIDDINCRYELYQAGGKYDNLFPIISCGYSSHLYVNNRTNSFVLSDCSNALSCSEQIPSTAQSYRNYFYLARRQTTLLFTGMRVSSSLNSEWIALGNGSPGGIYASSIHRDASQYYVEYTHQTTTRPNTLNNTYGTLSSIQSLKITYNIYTALFKKGDSIKIRTSATGWNTTVLGNIYMYIWEVS